MKLVWIWTRRKESGGINVLDWNLGPPTESPFKGVDMMTGMTRFTNGAIVTVESAREDYGVHVPSEVIR